MVLVYQFPALGSVYPRRIDNATSSLLLSTCNPRSRRVRGSSLLQAPDDDVASRHAELIARAIVADSSSMPDDDEHRSMRIAAVDLDAERAALAVLAPREAATVTTDATLAPI